MLVSHQLLCFFNKFIWECTTFTWRTLRAITIPFVDTMTTISCSNCWGWGPSPEILNEPRRSDVWCKYNSFCALLTFQVIFYCFHMHRWHNRWLCFGIFGIILGMGHSWTGEVWWIARWILHPEQGTCFLRLCKECSDFFRSSKSCVSIDLLSFSNSAPSSCLTSLLEWHTRVYPLGGVIWIASARTYLWFFAVTRYDKYLMCYIDLKSCQYCGHRMIFDILSFVWTATLKWTVQFHQTHNGSVLYFIDSKDEISSISSCDFIAGRHERQKDKAKSYPIPQIKEHAVRAVV